MPLSQTPSPAAPAVRSSQPASLVGGLARRLVGFAGGSVARGAVLSLAIKVASAGLTLLMFTLASHAMDGATFGRLSVWFNALSFAAVFTVFGQDNLIVRLWSEYRVAGRPGLARGAYRHGWMVIAVTTAGVVAVVAVATTAAFGLAPGLVAAGCAFLAAQTCLHYSSHSCRLIRHQLIADGNREIPWRVTVIVVLLACMAERRAVPIAAFFWAAAAGMALAIICQSLAVAARFPAEIRAAAAERLSRQWLGTSVGLWFPAVLEAASQYAEVVLIGVLLDPIAAGGYFVALRFANVFPMIATGLNAYALNRIAGFHFQGRTDDLARMIRSIMVVGTGLTVAFLALVLAAGPLMLRLFGDRYVGDYPTLVVLSLGTAFVTLSGPTAVSLLTTGHEFIYSRAVAVAMLARFGLLAVLVPRLGALGAATAWTISSVPLAIVLVAACRRLLRIDPSALCLIGRGERRRGG